MTLSPVGHWVAPPTATPAAAVGAPLMWGAFDIGAGGGGPAIFLPPGIEIANPYTAPSVFPLRWVSPRAGTARNISVIFNVADPAALTEPVVFTLEIAGAPSALSVTRNADAGVGVTSDFVTSVAVAQGETLAMLCSKALPIGGGLLLVAVSVEFL